MENAPKIERSLTELTREELNQAIIIKLEEVTDRLSEVEKYPEAEQREIAKARARASFEDLTALHEALGANKREKIAEMRNEDGLDREIPEIK